MDSFEQPGTINGVASGFSGTLFTDIITGIVYPANGIGANYNFADLPVSHIRGTVYQDLNANGLFDNSGYPYETGMRYVSVTLTGIDDVGASVALTRITDVSGGYDFDILRPGLYTVTEIQPTELEWRRANGHPVVLEAQTVQAELEGQPANVAILRDVTERKALQAHLITTDRLATGARRSGRSTVR